MKSMRDRLIGLIQNAPRTDTVYGNIKLPHPVQTVQTIADHLLVSGVIVPPCKVGDELWVIWSLHKNIEKSIYPVKVYAFRFDTKKNNMRICVEGQFEITAYGGRYTHHYSATFTWNSVGKTVFVTREEAEAKLKGGE